MISAVKGLQLSLPACNVGMFSSFVEFCCWEHGIQVKQAFSVGKTSRTVFPLFQTCMLSIQKNFTLAFSLNFSSIINLSLHKGVMDYIVTQPRVRGTNFLFFQKQLLICLNTFIPNASSILSQLFLYFLYRIYYVRTWGSVNLYPGFYYEQRELFLVQQFFILQVAALLMPNCCLIVCRNMRTAISNHPSCQHWMPREGWDEGYSLVCCLSKFLFTISVMIWITQSLFGRNLMQNSLTWVSRLYQQCVSQL